MQRANCVKLQRGCVMASPQTSLIARGAAENFEKLEALFEAILTQADDNTYLQSLVCLGAETASGYASQMVKIAEDEEQEASQ